MSVPVPEDRGTWTHVHAPDPAARFLIVGVTVLASALLLLVHAGIDGHWPAFSGPESLTLWYTGAGLVPGFVAMLIDRRRDALPWAAGAAYAAILLPLAWHTGHAGAPDATDAGIFAPYALSLAAATFIVAPFVQSWRSTRLPIPYPALFQHAWNNTVTLMIAGAFTGAVWLILWLWAGLFLLLDIRFFKSLFTDRNFIYLATGLLAGVGVVIGRTQFGAARAVLNVHLALGRALLPLIVVVALLFLGAIAFSSLEPLWKTGHAALLLDWLIVVTVVLINYVYQDGDSVRPYVRPLTLATNAALLALPMFALVALYGIHLRVGQHGWTTERLWAALVTTFAAAYAFAYAISVVLPSGRWLRPMGAANVWIAALIAVTLLLTQSPLLDFRRIAVSDQLARESDPSKLDLKWLRFDAGRPGYEALLALKSDPRVTRDPDLVAEIDRTLKGTNRFLLSKEGPAPKAGNFTTIPPATPIPPELLAAMKDVHSFVWRDRCMKPEAGCMLMDLPLGANGRRVWVLFDPMMPWTLPVYVQSRDGTWKLAGQLQPIGGCCGKHDAVAGVKQGKVRVEPSEWNDVSLGTQKYRLQPMPGAD